MIILVILYHVNAATELANNVENVSSSVYIAKFLEIWHVKFGHLNVASIKRPNK